ncbi:MAG TPA: nitrogen fixation protein NifQ [Paraburkholderia sp.]|jgi:nitrogen fixation protein NifQ|nr:nitrogen fixation protein NifQ [Paraburkholderia sp.]
MPDDTFSASPPLPAHAAAHAQDLAEACAARTGHWMAAAVDPRSYDAWLLAKLIATREVRGELASLGLSPEHWGRLVSRHFTGDAMPSAPAGGVTMLNKQEHVDFVTKLRALMLRYVSPVVSGDDAQCLASIIVHACLRPDHLWRDLGLAGREEVSVMLDRYFPALVALNVENLRWKKFLAQQLALSLGQEPGPAPGCPGCEDYGHCFPCAV